MAGWVKVPVPSIKPGSDPRDPQAGRRKPTPATYL